MKKKIIYLFVALALLLSLIPVMGIGTAAAAGPWYVDPSGTDDVSHGLATGTGAFLTIQYAINDSRVVGGDTINVAAGIYAGNIHVTKSLTIVGNPGDASPGPGPNAPVIDGGSAPGDAFFIDNGVSNVTIQGFEMRNFTSNDTGVGNGISAWEASTSNITIQDNYFHNLGYNGVLVGNDGAIGDHTGWKIKGNILETFEAYGFELTNASDSSIENNIIHSNAVWNLASTCIMVDARRNESGIVIKGNQINGEMWPGYPAVYVFANSFETPNVNLNDVLIQDNIISTTGTVAQIMVYNYPGTGTVTGVHVHNNSLGSLRNSTPATIDATLNWWGTIDPVAIAAKITGSGAGLVTYDPWLGIPTTVYVDATYTGSSAGGHLFGYDAFTAVQEGVSAVAADGTVNVAAGTYNTASTMVVNKALTISGPAVGGGGAKVQGTGGLLSVFEIAASNVVIQNLEITVTSAGTFNSPPDNELATSLIRIPSGVAMTGIAITGNTIYVPTQSGAMSTWNARAITVGGGTVSGISITGNTIHNTRNGVVVQYNNTATINNNIIYDTKGGILNYTSSLADVGTRTMSGNQWGTTHNEWDIVWNTAYYVPDYQQSVLVLSGANNDAYVLDRRAADAAACDALTSNRSHIFVNAATGTLTKHPANGNMNVPYATIALGIEAVVPGGTVYVAAGTYTGAVLAKDVTLVGAAGGGSVIATGVPYKDGGALTTAFRLDATADGAEIRNFTVNCNDSAGFYFGVFARGADNVVVDSLTVNDAVQGITTWGGSNWEIAHNVLTDTIAAGGGGIAIYLGATPPSYLTCSGNYVHDNTISSAATAPDYTCPGVVLALDLRDTYGVPNGAEDLSGNQIEDNDYTGTGNLNEVGIEIGVIGVEGDAPKIAATLGMIHDNTVSGNTVDGADYGMYFYTVTDLEVLDNDVINCATAGIYLADGISGGQFSGNSIYGNAYGFINETGAIVDATDNWWGTASGPAHSSNTFNVGSQGNAVSNNVDFVPWLDAAPPGGVSFAPVTTTDPVGSYASIQAGVTASNPGGTVNVAAGTYNENIVINKRLTVQGAGLVTTFINAQGTGASVTAVNITAAGDVTLSGFTITNAPVTNNTDLRFGVLTNSGTAGVTYTISNNKVVGTNNPDAEEDYGIYGQNGGKENLVITNNVVTKTGANNIVVETHLGTTDISSNTLDASCDGSDAIFIMTHSGVNVAALQKVDNNTIDMGTGVASVRATGITFATAVNSTPGGTFTNVQITNNKVSNLKANRRGIGLANQATTPSAGDINGALITGNTITGAAGDVTASMGINTYGLVTNATITGNTITGVDFSFKERLNGAIIATGTKLNENSLVSSGSGVVTERTTGTLDATCNWWGAANGPSTVGTGSGTKVSANVDYNPWQIAQSGACGFTINASVSGSHGSVDPGTRTGVLYGADASIGITPASGYRIASITDNSSTATIANPYVILGVTADHNVVVTFTNIPATPILSSPANGANMAGTSIPFVWSAPSGTTMYWLEVNTDASWGSATRFYYAQPSTNSQTVTGFPNTGKTYYWRAWAGNSFGWSAPTSGWSVVNGTATPPATPTLTSPGDGAHVSGTSITFVWSAPSGTTMYWLEVNTDASWGSGTRFYYAQPSTNSQTVTGFPNNGTTYYWRAWAGNSNGWSAPTADGRSVVNP